MKHFIAALLLIPTQAFAQLCESGYCPENGYPPVGRAYEVKHEPREVPVYKPVERPRIETYSQQYERTRDEPSVSPLGVPNINKPRGSIYDK